MDIHPYTSVDSLLFDTSDAADCIRVFGEPKRTSRNRDGLDEFHYETIILRFDSGTGYLKECTLLPYADARIGEQPVTWDIPFLRAVCEWDGAPVDIYGFIVLPTIGLAITGIHDDDTSQLAITVISRGMFDSLMGEAKPFDWRRLGQD